MSDALAYQITETTPRIPRRRGRLRALPGRAARWLGRRRGALLALAALALLGLRHPADARQRDAAEGEAQAIAADAVLERARAERAEATLERVLWRVADDPELVGARREQLLEPTREYFAHLTSDERHAPPARRAWAHLLAARRAEATGYSVTARQEYQKALELAEALAASEADPATHRGRAAECHARLGDIAAAEGNTAEAERRFRAALARWDGPDGDGRAAATWNVARCRGELGLLLHAANDFVGAEREYLSALWHFERPAGGPESDAACRQVVRLGTRLAELYAETGRLSEALGRYARTEPAGERLDRAESPPASDRRAALAFHVSRARLLIKTGSRAESLPDWGRAVELCSRDERGPLRRERLETLTAADRHDEAAAEAADLWATSRPDAALAMLAARASSRAVPAGGRAAEARAIWAVSLLGEARKLGHLKGTASADALRADPDFVPLRDRDDFAALLATLGPEPLPLPASGKP